MPENPDHSMLGTGAQITERFWFGIERPGRRVGEKLKCGKGKVRSMERRLCGQQRFCRPDEFLIEPNAQKDRFMHGSVLFLTSNSVQSCRAVRFFPREATGNTHRLDCCRREASAFGLRDESSGTPLHPAPPSRRHGARYDSSRRLCRNRPSVRGKECGMASTADAAGGRQTHWKNRMACRLRNPVPR